MHCDYLIVGAGFFGSVLAERIASQLDKKVILVDKRNHIGGNCHSQIDQETKIEFHSYGTHIFHTNSQNVWNYLKNFTEFNNYKHQVLTEYQNKIYQMPINLETINSFYNKNFKPFEAKEFIANECAREFYQNPKSLEEKAISQIGRPLYEAFIKGYTQKQWQRDPKELPASIINRLPLRFNYDETYFHNAQYEGIPKDGYTAIFEKLLNHKNIKVLLQTDYFDVKDQIQTNIKTIYSGPIDRLFNYQFGELDWRSISLEKKIVPHQDYLGTSVLNFADSSNPYTRVHEPRHLHPERNYQSEKTVLFYEKSGFDKHDPYYPIADKKNLELLQKYKNLAENCSNIIIGGRLGSYQYYDMDQVIASALTCFETKIKKV